ncbi:hypothetical protein CEE45_11700 [Candidatus Heimdallarchaeota archaeon B3_Heim]|nr:MAG: hypothetical protein CEE45_11700 [Candidatus Heimdallarchaeota archaeon B3_Heim]
MDLSAKYLYGSGFLIGVWFIVSIFSINSSLLFSDITSSYYYLFFTAGPLPFILIGLSISTMGIYFYVLLFTKERIRGLNLEFEASPDLKTFRVVKDHSPNRLTKKEIPDTAYCGACGREVHKPFRCAACGQLLCATHILAGDHRCKEGI